MKAKLGKRLKHIFDLIGDEYEECWDTCCDHGMLGLALLEYKKVKKVYFVDRVTSIIKNLDRKLKSISELEPDSYDVCLLDAKNIKITSTKNIICICGVGGNVAIDIIEGLSTNNNLNDYDILVSVNYHIYELRNYLSINSFKSVKEYFFYDGRWPYEVLIVSKNRGDILDDVGVELFKNETEDNKKYINSKIEHYKKKSLSDNKYFEICNKYKNIKELWKI